MVLKFRYGESEKMNEKNKEHFNFQFDSESIQNLTELMSEGSKSIFRERSDLH